jgi:hypothetical protein
MICHLQKKKRQTHNKMEGLLKDLKLPSNTSPADIANALEKMRFIKCNSAFY